MIINMLRFKLIDIKIFIILVSQVLSTTHDTMRYET